MLNMNRLFWKKNFQGFRFPYVSNSFWGMYLLDKLGFVYETSIAANNFDFIRGSVVPYNIPIFNNEFYQTLDLLEISQMYRSDWYFYQKVLDDEPYTVEDQKKDAEKFRQYLFKYFTKVVEPNNGVMVFLGHPMYTGLNNITMQPLQEFISYIKNKNVWITSLNEAAERWNKLKNLDVEIEENDNKVVINIDIHNQEIKGLTFRLDETPKQVIYNGEYRLKNSDGIIFLILDLSNKNTLTLKY